MQKIHLGIEICDQLKVIKQKKLESKLEEADDNEESRAHHQMTIPHDYDYFADMDNRVACVYIPAMGKSRLSFVASPPCEKTKGV
jgi:hypothetical protein